MVDQVEPCPFCKSQRVEIERDLASEQFVICNKCFACGPDCKTAEQAIAAWNTRTAYNPQPSGDQVEKDEMVSRVEAWLEANPTARAALPPETRETLSDCAEFLADINGDLALRCEAALVTAYNPNERLREALELVVSHERATGTAEEKLASAIGIAREALALTPPSDLSE